MEKVATFAEVFARLRAILTPHADRLKVVHDTPEQYYLNGAPTAKYPDGIFFGAVIIKKSYVSYHLMALYADPSLVMELSDALRKRMQGKSCFNFTTLQEPLFGELAQVTARAIAGYEQRGWLLPVASQ